MSYRSSQNEDLRPDGHVQPAQSLLLSEPGVPTPISGRRIKKFRQPCMKVRGGDVAPGNMLWAALAAPRSLDINPD